MSGFASKSVAGHLARGVTAALLFAGAVYFNAIAPCFAALAIVSGLLLLRGCPVCWTVGLYETIANRRSCGAERTGTIDPGA